MNRLAIGLIINLNRSWDKQDKYILTINLFKYLADFPKRKKINLPAKNRLVKVLTSFAYIANIANKEAAAYNDKVASYNEEVSNQ